MFQTFEFLSGHRSHYRDTFEHHLILHAYTEHFKENGSLLAVSQTFETEQISL